MAILITMPSLSPTMESGVISAWRKQVGDMVEVGEVLAEIETDKAVMDFEVVDEGVLREILVGTGDEIAVGTPIAILADSKEEDISDLLQQAKAGAAAASPVAPVPQPPAEPAPSPASPAPGAPTTAPPPPAALLVAAAAGKPGGRVKISPYGRKLAAEKNIDIAQLTGSGPGGRIVARDVDAAIAASAEIAAGAETMAASAAAVVTGRPALAVVDSGEAFEDFPLSMMRKTIARKMEESKRTVPHFQATRKVRMERMLDMRADLKRDFPDVRISINDLIVKACAVALKFHPMVNSQFLGDRIRRFHTIDISVAVATPEGLITPVVRAADRKSCSQIATEIRELAARAREKKLTPDEYQGGTFTVSNLGMYGIDEFNGIINTPQACLLAVSAVVREPVVQGDAVVPGHTMNLTLSSDHRVVDGATAAEFLRTLTRVLENPLALVM